MVTDASKLEEQDGKVILQNSLKLNMSLKDYLYMQCMQAYVMEILLAVDQFCRDNNLTYYLGEGTLLGAVRHGGFIPWDDDADIYMPRADYDRFLQLAKNGLPEGYALDSMDTNPRHWTPIVKVQMTRKVPYFNKMLEGIALHSGPFIDIFPLDFVPSDRPEDVAKRGKKIQILRRTMWIKSGNHTRQQYKTLRLMLKYYYPLKIYGAFYSSLRAIYNQIQRIMTATNDPSLGYLCAFDSLYPAERESFKKEYFGTPMYIEFEGHMLPVPSNPDRILKRIYGDYMQYPPVQERTGQHFFTFDEEAMKEFGDDEAFRQIFEILKEETAKIQPAKKEGVLAKIKKRLGRAANKRWKKIRELARREFHAMRSRWIVRYYKLQIPEKTVNKETWVMNSKNNRKKLLFMAEFSQSFVSQTALTELLKQIDYSKYDVTLLTGEPWDEYRKEMLEELDPHVHILINDKAINCNLCVRKAVYKALEKGKISLDNAVQKLGCSYEWQRLVGDSVFDQLCVLQPTFSAPNWLILSYIAPINNKVFIQSETAFRSTPVQKSMLDHFNTVYDELDHYCETL